MLRPRGRRAGIPASQNLTRRHSESLAAGFGKLHVDDVTQLLLGEVGDSDSGGVALHGNPLVLGRIAAVLRIHAFSSSARDLGGPV